MTRIATRDEFIDSSSVTSDNERSKTETLLYYLTANEEDDYRGEY